MYRMLSRLFTNNSSPSPCQLKIFRYNRTIDFVRCNIPCPLHHRARGSLSRSRERMHGHILHKRKNVGLRRVVMPEVVFSRLRQCGIFRFCIFAFVHLRIFVFVHLHLRSASTLVGLFGAVFLQKIAECRHICANQGKSVSISPFVQYHPRGSALRHWRGATLIDLLRLRTEREPH